ncbi:hypothetical protein [Neobacillus sp. SuZ13]|uniref:hypothetical protein n=1 Tax=Neobacillus sp. SuZ13 TaxID=3047875 RepID=UPI0024C05B75|nr:hypothetical protein [Neobacillus sp. SuZ13]WHY64760.1 hypothetical protein QNH17_16720 [Neobacillus sp. SuZ13]
MFNLLIFGLIAITLVLLSIFVDGLMRLNKEEKEAEKNTVRDGMHGYLFGLGKVKIFKTIHDADGNLRYLVYLPQYEWFKAPTYKWYEVYATHNGFQHIEVER